MLSSTRERRCNAGTRMANLLENEEEDAFYSTLYGGFREEEDDREYVSEEEESDATDSDISIDENDEVISEDEEQGAKRKVRVVTKSYKEPEKVKKDMKKKPGIKPQTSVCSAPAIGEKKSMRDSTVLKSAETKQRTCEMASMRSRQQKKKSIENYGLTQEELLEEAKITELENLKSLETFQRLELEKKKVKSLKHTYTGPMIRYHSVTMPLIEDPENSDQVCKKYSRNFITFTDDKLLKEYFPQTKPKPAPRSVCPVTGAAPRYFDPLTGHPYSNSSCFSVIRDAYYTEVEKKLDPIRHPMGEKWLEWRKQMKAKQLAAKMANAS